MIERSLIIIENQKAVQRHLISCIANLTVVNKRDLGRKCFELLGRLLDPSADRTLQQHVKMGIDENIMPWLQFKDLESMDADRKDKLTSLIEGLNYIIVSSEIAAIFETYIDYTKSWILQVAKHLEKSHKQQSESDYVYDELLK